MKSCGSILLVGAIVLGIGVAFVGGETPGWFITVLVVMGAAGLIIQSAGKKKPDAAGSGAGQSKPALRSGRGPQLPGGWAYTERSDALASEWKNNHPVLPNNGLWSVRTGKAHRRQVSVFQSSRFPPTSTFMVFRMPEYNGPQFTATSDGRSEITVSGTMAKGLSEMLTSIGPRAFKRLGVTGRLFWVDLGTMAEAEVDTFISKRLPGFVHQVTEHLTPDRGPGAQADTPQQAAPAPAQRPTQQAPRQPQPAQRVSSGRPQTAQRQPAQRPAAQQPRQPRQPQPTMRQAPARPQTAAGGVPPTMPTTKLPHDLGPDPDDILQTGPIELNERPALKPAQADPISRSLENPELVAGWAPIEWTPTPFELTAPMGLGETPSATQELAGGWKPREWSAPDYGSSQLGEWKPAETWQPNYNTTSSD
ncbi:hypothetical protein ACPCG0_09195 [Propionibacteriaceae bacterium Y1923]